MLLSYIWYVEYTTLHIYIYVQKNKHICSVQQNVTHIKFIKYKTGFLIINQLDVLISQIYSWNKTLHILDSSPVHHQDGTGVPS